MMVIYDDPVIKLYRYHVSKQEKKHNGGDHVSKAEDKVNIKGDAQ